MAEYTVELPMHIQGADTPEEAVEAFIEQIISYGMRTWTYLVTDGEGNTVRIKHEPHRQEPEEPEESDEPRPEPPAEEPE